MPALHVVWYRYGAGPLGNALKVLREMGKGDMFNKMESNTEYRPKHSHAYPFGGGLSGAQSLLCDGLQNSAPHDVHNMWSSILPLRNQFIRACARKVGIMNGMSTAQPICSKPCCLGVQQPAMSPAFQTTRNNNAPSI